MSERFELMPDVYLQAITTSKFKTACLSINFIRPLNRYEAPRAALLPNVLLRGTSSYPDIRHISGLLDQLYGASVGTLVRKKGEVLTTGFYADFLEDCFVPEPVFAPMMCFLRELLMQPLLEQDGFIRDYVAGERQSLLDAIDARIDDKDAYAVRCMLESMCKEEAYHLARLGEREDAQSITAEDLMHYYQHMLAHSRVELFYMGRKPPQQAAEAMRDLLQGLPRAIPDTASTTVVSSVSGVRELHGEMEVVQGKLVMGFRTGCVVKDREYPALMLLNMVYGGSSTSKLFLTVREERALCYYVASSLDKHKGIMIVNAGIDFDRFEDMRDEIFAQLDACRSGDITDEEMETARRTMLSALQASRDAPGRMDDYLLDCAISSCGRTLEQLEEEIRRLDKSDLIAAAKRITLDTVYFLKGANA